MYKDQFTNINFEYIYIEDFLEQSDYKKIIKELTKYNKILDSRKEDIIKYNRYNTNVDSKIVESIIKKYENKIRNLTNNQNIYLANNFPIEYRKYLPGSFMIKHRDTMIYKIPQYECILTLTNTTDSVTDMDGEQIKSKPNSLIIVRANGIEHHVTKVSKGERKFIKFIFTETDEFY
jgi:hypothetical protein